ncbi:hypothetical protein QVD17_38126 [Tagetes erecta]|uniref:Uncharacterized protein n=1 Tax=Tagetes erecta TaxID=13708 RepID=A0AAD8JV88_TARER|nr:hypothetical protein QVD17_38126 [Tagetes erecta]
MFETCLQVSKACDEKRRDCHEHALVTQSKSDDNEDEEEYDWSEGNDVVSIKELAKKDIEISNLSETIVKQEEIIAQLNSEIKRLMYEKEIEKDVQSSFVEIPIDIREKMCTKECFQQCEHYRTYSFRIWDKFKDEEKRHKNLQEQHKASDHRITSLQESLKKSEREITNVKNEAEVSNEHLSRVINDFQEEIQKLNKLSEMFKSENNVLKTKLQEEQEKFTSLQKITNCVKINSNLLHRFLI